MSVAPGRATARDRHRRTQPFALPLPDSISLLILEWLSETYTTATFRSGAYPRRAPAPSEGGSARDTVPGSTEAIRVRGAAQSVSRRVRRQFRDRPGGDRAARRRAREKGARGTPAGRGRAARGIAAHPARTRPSRRAVRLPGTRRRREGWDDPRRAAGGEPRRLPRAQLQGAHSGG